MREKSVPWRAYALVLFVCVELVCWTGFFYARGQADERRVLLAKPKNGGATADVCLKSSDAGRCDAVRTVRDQNTSEKATLIAQQEATRWAWWSALFAAVQLPISLAGIVAVIATIRQGQHALLQDREFAEADLRPWLRISATITNGRLDDSILKADLILKLTNVGRDVARNVQTFRASHSYEAQESISAVNKARAPFYKSWEERGFTVLPGDEQKSEMLYEHRVSELCFTKSEGGEIAVITVAAWCDYTFGNGKKGHTLNLYQLGIKVGDQKYLGLPNSALTVGQLDLFLEIQHGNEAR